MEERWFVLDEMIDIKEVYPSFKSIIPSIFGSGSVLGKFNYLRISRILGEISKPAQQDLDKSLPIDLNPA